MNHRTEPGKRLQGYPCSFEFRVSSFEFRIHDHQVCRWSCSRLATANSKLGTRNSKLFCPANSKLELRNLKLGPQTVIPRRDTIALTPPWEHVEGPRPRPTHRLRRIQKAAPHLSDAVVLQTCRTQLGLVCKNRGNLVTQKRLHPFFER